MSSSGPLFVPRLITLGLAAAFGVIAGGVALNALIESKKNVDGLQKFAPAGTTLDISIKDVRGAGAGAAAGAVLLALFSSASAGLSFLPSTRDLSLRTLRQQSLAVLFSVVVIIASMIPYTYFFANRGPSVKAFLGSVQLPNSVVAPLVAARVGAKAFYKNIDYLRLLAVFPWIAVFFGLIAAFVLFKASSSTPTEAPKSVPETAEKSSVSLHEKV
ncbi:hypothetical protein BJ165DRAFT_190357 [Panaeolus papilionaceus]|nr:hypothetical protein BJ165DRAFT_190357 [Panaeolus papilionaceus]